MTHAETAALIATMIAAYPGKGNIPDPEARSRVWARMFADIELPEALAALDECIATSPHFPSVADIRSRVAARRAPSPDIADAWGEVRRAIGTHGRDREPRWSSPRIAAAVGAIGWRSICDSDIGDERTLMAQFERLYKAGIETARKEANVGSLEAARSGGALSAGQALAKLSLTQGGRE